MLEALHGRLGQVEELATRTAREHDALKQGPRSSTRCGSSSRRFIRPSPT